MLNDNMIIILTIIFLCIFWYGIRNDMYLSKDVSKNNYIVVDFSKPSNEKRFFIYDYKGKLLYSTFVSHGKNSGDLRNTKRFSNARNSLQSSLGTFRVGEQYRGKHGVSWRLDGLSKTNSNARSRYIVIHPAPYIGYGKTGRSEGCFAIPERDAKEAYKYIKTGVFLYAVY